MARNPFALLKGPQPSAAIKRFSPKAKAAPVVERAAFDPRKAVLALHDLVPGQARLVVPFPPAGLNPNARHGHPAQKGRIGGQYRELCWALALEALGAGYKRHLPEEGPIRVHLDFFPPTGAKRDDDNLEAAFKSGRDGISRAMGIDDSRWVTSKRLRLEVRGCVVVTVLPDPQHPIYERAGQ